MERIRRQTSLSWVFVGALVILCCVLGFLQYQWIGEVSRAEQKRMQDTLQVGLSRLRQTFNAELAAACTGLLPVESGGDEHSREAAYAARIAQRQEGLYGQLIKAVFLAVPVNDVVELRRFDTHGRQFVKLDWSADWSRLHERLEQRLAGGPPIAGRPPDAGDPADVVTIPNVVSSEGERFGGRRVSEWLVVQFDVDYIRKSVIPRLIEQSLGASEAADYAVEIVTRNQPSSVIYRSDPSATVQGKADASISLFEVRFDPFVRGFGGPAGPGSERGPGMDREGGPERRGDIERGAGPDRGFGPDRGPAGIPRPGPGGFRGPDRGRWELSVRHRSGSLEALVARTRTRNLAVTAALLALIVAAAAALMRFTRRAQRLAGLQMQFVAGVSHELRTPLAVMRTAGHNLQGKVADDPGRVRRYGALMEEESQKLTAIVEQVLRFANVNAGRVIGGREPVEVASVIDEAIRASKAALEESGCVLEKDIAGDLPPVLADRTTLQHALQNLLSNAAKYGKSGGWVGVSASSPLPSTIEVCVRDRGPGIPPDEIDQIFDPFYRGKRPTEDQIHGTGLGLTLAKKIVEAHGGTILVDSEPGKGTQFSIRLAAAPATNGEQDVANSTC